MNPHQLADYLATDDGLATLRSLQGLGLLGGATAAAPVSSGPHAVLDWKPVTRGAELTFERDAAYRCKPKVLRPQHAGTLRVCLFGESLAAGFPLAPIYSPAIALEELLRAALGSDRPVEVIDLAMPNMGPSEQLRVCEAARQLAPDVFVFLTGNNWYYGLPVEPTAAPDARSHYARHLADGGAERLAQTFRTELAARARVMLKVLAQAAHSASARAIVVIPAANHAWERRTPPPWLGGGRTATWFAQLRIGEDALAAGDPAAALAAATALEALDGGMTGTPQRLAARAHLAAGCPAAARDAALRAIDASNWHNYSWALPQVPSYVADLMRASAAELDYTCVDLEPLFVAHTGAPFLDFRMFFDHCHLSTEGTQVAMAAVASAIATPLASRPVSGPALTAAATRPTGLAAGSATFQAAHWLSQFFPADAATVEAQLRTQLHAAIDADDHLATVMTDQLRFKAVACTPALHGAFPAAARVPGVGAALSSRRLNPPFFAALVDVLRARGGELAAGVDDVLGHVLATHEQALRAGVDLSHPQWWEWFWERTPRAWNDPCERQGAPFYRAAWPTSRFGFLTAASHPLALELVARAASRGTVAVHVNDAPLGALELGAGWRRWQTTIEPTHLTRGLNRVCLTWPALAVDDDAALAAATRRFELGTDADLFPVFGEVYALTVRT